MRGLNDTAQKTPRCKLVLLGEWVKLWQPVHESLAVLLQLHETSCPPPAGDSGVGKSCLVTQYARGSFDPDSRVTVGAAFMSQTVQLPEDRSVKFEIW